jgi:hypothetical protein
VPEREGVPQVDAQISAMEHKEAAYEAQVTFNMRLVTCNVSLFCDFL